MLRHVLILSCAFLTVLGDTPPSKCKLDRACVTKHTIAIYKHLFENENYHLDPMYQKLIEGDLGTLKYTLTNTTIRGFKNCSVKNGNLDLKKMELDVDFYCPEFHLIGSYNINGLLFALPVEGNGRFTLDTKTYDVKIRMGVSLIPEGDKHHLQINNFNMDLMPLEKLVYNFENLFNGQKELADNFHQFVNENWKIVTIFLQEPVFRACFKKIVKASNVFFKEQMIENYIEM